MTRIGLGVVVMALVGCGGKSPTMAMSTIAPTGGTVQTPGGATTIEVPSGALTMSTPITIESSAVKPATSVGDALVFGPEGQQFATPVTVTLTFDPAKLPQGTTSANVSILTAPAGSSDFTRLPTTLVDATHVRTTVSHFSIFGPAACKGDGPVCIAPTQCKAAGGACTTAADCCSGTACSDAGVCVAPTNGGCAAGQTLCDGGCKNLTNDPAHCGSCATSCGTGGVCSNSQCAQAG